MSRDAPPNRAARIATIGPVTVQLSFEPDHLGIAFTGVDRALALKGSLRLPWADIVGAEVVEQREAKRTLGIRLGGGYFPGWFATGHFTYRHRRGERQLWCCYRARRVLCIETRRPKPRRVVLQLDEPDAMAARITERASTEPDQQLPER